MNRNRDLDELIDVSREMSKPESARDDSATAYSRRTFLKSGVAAAAATVVMPFDILGSGKVQAASLPYSPDYGPLAPVADGTTGLALLGLPAGFKYFSYGWTGDVMSDGVPTPGSHDGMAVCGQDANKIVLVRNHERTGTDGSFGAAKITYDPVGIGGCTSLYFNPRNGQWMGSFASIAGTINNCAGGPTPWGSWITCEENTSGPLTNPLYTKQHGYCFEVPAFGPTQPVPLNGMGAFVHEAVAVDPATGIVYLTEDDTPSGFYRFVPNVKTRLNQGGQLEMLKIVGVSSARLYGNPASASPALVPNGTTYDVEWVPIAEPEKVYSTGTTGNGVFTQGDALGGAGFARGEGCWYGNGVVWFISTSGGITGNGQVWKYDPRAETLTMVYESPGAGTLDNPDNVAWSPRGSLILCEDGDNPVQRLHGLTPSGTIFPFCENQVVLANFKGFNGSFQNREFAGATFHNEWLFVNIQTPGITFAITGPWDNGAL
ncbi:MAG: DUF839 domain-containing protein [Betaproteobacteria bacterium]|nr:DUF839 domain-containing protein [Betaproteobacteria bacterium]